MKRKILCMLLALLFTASVSAWAETVPVAPETAAGHIMAYVVNDAGAEVLKGVYDQGAAMETVETIPYGTEIDIRTLGLSYCRLRRDGKEELYVRTRDLSFSAEPFEGQLAVVFTKRDKYLPMHKTASAKSKRVVNVPDGSYVVALEKGDTFSRVLYGKYDGYLQNSYLSFRVAWQEDAQQAILRDPKNEKHVTTVNLRSADSPNGKKVTTLPTFQKGTRNPYVVMVLQYKGEWAEIETKDGIHGYLKGEWTELIERADAEPADEAHAADAAPQEEAEPAGTDDEAAAEIPAAEEPAPADDEAETVTPEEEDEPAVVDDEEEAVAADDEEPAGDDEPLFAEDPGPEWEE